MNPEEIFLNHQAFVRKTAGALARHYRLPDADAEDFISAVNLKLIADDYAVLRKFQGKSQVKTYLRAVISRALHDFRSRLWGRWRPSTAAERLGAVAETLDCLLSRDGHSLTEAINILIVNHKVEMSPAELEAIASKLPRRSPRRFEDESKMPDIEAPDRADDNVRIQEQGSQQELAETALRKALKQLPAEDQVILRMRYWDGFQIKAIAKALHLPPRPLYRRVERLNRKLRGMLEEAGVQADTIEGILD